MLVSLENKIVYLGIFEIAKVNLEKYKADVLILKMYSFTKWQ